MSNDGEGIGPLAGLRVVDLTDRLGAYASRLLGDLGAEVIRIKRPRPTTNRDGTGAVDAHAHFVNAGKRSLTLDLDRPEGLALLGRLLAGSDILVEGLSVDQAARYGLDPDTLREQHPRLVHVTVTPLGRDRTDWSVPDDDLTVMAAGGLLNLGGYPDAEPVVAYGMQSHVAASIFAAVGALVAVLDRESTGRGRWVDISAQECVAQALEDSVATYDLTGHVRMRLGSDPREAGTGMYPCKDGYVAMVAGRLGTAKAWQALVAWLVEVGIEGADALAAPEWSTLTHRQRPASIERFGEIFHRFASTRTREELYHEAQRRQIALSPVNGVADVMADAQLTARDFFVDVDDTALGRRLQFPGPPYRLSVTPARPARSAPRRGGHTDEVLASVLDLPAEAVASLRDAGVV
jgi:benzylsuccinate CoA-transferase BbsE subunit